MIIMKYLYVAIAMLIALMGLEIILLKKENSNLLKDTGAFKAQIAELSGTIVIKDKDLDLCNKRTEELRKQADDRAAQAEKARQDARKVAQENRELADRLLSFTRKPGQTSCDAANELFNSYLDERQNRAKKVNPN